MTANRKAEISVLINRVSRVAHTDLCMPARWTWGGPQSADYSNFPALESSSEKNIFTFFNVKGFLSIAN
jgi:hypothetical protein